MNEVLADSILEDCSDERLFHVRSFILSYAALVTLLHSLVGLEVGTLSSKISLFFCLFCLFCYCWIFFC